jgi:hypothetical protein
MFLLCLLAALIVIQQLRKWEDLRSSELRSSRNRSHVEGVIQHANLAEREQVSRGALWIGRLHDQRGEPANDDSGHHSLAPAATDSKRIAGRIDLGQDSLSAIVNLHECHPGSWLCSTGGEIILLDGERTVCAFSVGLLQPPEDGGQDSYYCVSWKDREGGIALTEPERLKILERLAGAGEVPDRAWFHRLLRTAYGYESPVASLRESESIQKAIVRSVLGAIARSRADQQLPFEKQ